MLHEHRSRCTQWLKTRFATCRVFFFFSFSFSMARFCEAQRRETSPSGGFSLDMTPPQSDGCSTPETLCFVFWCPLHTSCNTFYWRDFQTCKRTFRVSQASGATSASVLSTRRRRASDAFASAVQRVWGAFLMSARVRRNDLTLWEINFGFLAKKEKNKDCLGFCWVNQNQDWKLI